MRGFRNSTAALALLAALSATAAAQDGSGIPRDPAQDNSAPRPPERGGSVAVPPPPVGTIGNPTPPSGGNDNYLPDELPVAGQPGEIAEQGDGAFDPSQPALLSPGSDAGPSSLPYGQTPEEIGRAQQVLANPAGTGMTPSAVEVRPLGKPDPSDKGTLAEGDGGLGGDLWGESDYATIADLMAAMPAGTPSPAMNELIRRVLLTGAKPQDGGDNGPTLYDLRTARLLDAGLVRDLAALLDLGDEKAGDPLARQQGYLLAAREREACAALGEDEAGASALMMRALCQIAAGDGAAAAMSADLARVKGAHDAAFFALVAHLADGAPLDAAALTKLSPITLTLARRAKAELTPAALDGATLGVAAALAGSKSTPAALRIAAATRAAADGALDPALLLDLVLAGKEAGAFGLVRTAIRTEGLEPRAKAIAAALDAGAAEDRTMLTAALLARAAWETPPSAALASYAAPVTRVLLLTGRGDRVADWLNFSSALPAGLADELTVQLALTAPSADRSAKASEALTRLAAASSGDAVLASRVMIYAAALEATGQPIPAAAQGLLAASPQFAGGSGQVETAELADAAREKRVGETILRALVLIGQGGPAKANPAVVIEAVAALSRVGLTREAAQLALEAALARPVAGGG
ncbi:MAG: hypothetical protein QM698_13890 [Micropepsaceae bacterium]